jgi:hypothetical protein
MWLSRALLSVAALGLATALGGCNTSGYADCNQVQCPYQGINHVGQTGYAPAYGEAPFDDPVSDYARRSVTIASGAGNAEAANLALQTATPWPRHSGNTNIPGNGAQMVRAVREFECGTRPKLDTTNGGGGIGIQNNNGGGGGGGGGVSNVDHNCK